MSTLFPLPTDLSKIDTEGVVINGMNIKLIRKPDGSSYWEVANKARSIIGFEYECSLMDVIIRNCR